MLLVSRSMTATTSSRYRTGITCRRMKLRGASTGGSSDITRSSSQACRSSGKSANAMTADTRSSTKAVTPVVGLACAAQTSSCPSVGTQSSRSENDRSASSCHSDTTACRCATADPDNTECSARTSDRVDMSGWFQV